MKRNGVLHSREAGLYSLSRAEPRRAAFVSASSAFKYPPEWWPSAGAHGTSMAQKGVPPPRGHAATAAWPPFA